MIDLYIGPCNSGKTQELIKKYEKVNKITSIFFPSGSEIQSILKGNDNKANGIDYENNLSILLNAFVQQKLSDDEKNNYKNSRDKILKAQQDVINEWKAYDEKSSNPLSQYIKEYSFSNNVELPKVTLSREKYSVGKIWYNHIILCLDLLKKLPNFKDFCIFMDEPESYMHPDWIKKVAIKLVDLNNENQEMKIYIASHSPIFIANVLNSTKFVKIHCKKQENDNWIDIDIKENQWYSINKLLYEIYNVDNIEFLDELIGDLKEKKSLDFMRSNDSRVSSIVNNTSIKRLTKPYQKDQYYHDTYISFVRNYFHHPDTRNFYSQTLTDNQTDINTLLNESIKNAIELLGDDYIKLL